MGSYLLEALHQLLHKNVVELIQNPQSLGFYNRLFLVPKPNNRWRPILDLSKLNEFLKTQSFKVETPETIRTSLQAGEWATSIDFKDAYFLIPINSQSRKYMRFHIQGKTYQFKALPFGLSTAPMEFTVIAKEVKWLAMGKGIRIHQYLDDWLVRAKSCQACLQQTQTLVALCRELGWLVNQEKSELEPKQIFNFVGYQFDLREGRVRPTTEWWQTLQIKIWEILEKQTAHKLPRTKSSSSGTKRVPNSLYKQGSPHSYRQHYCGRLHKQTRGNEVGSPMCLTLENTDLVHQKSSIPQSPTYSRLSEHDSRQAIQAGADHINGMVPQSGGIPSNMPPVAPTQCGSVCHQVQQQAPTVCLTGPRPPGLGSGCSQPVMGGTGPFPPAAIFGKVVEKLQDYPCNRIILIAPGWPNMPWFWDLVAMSTQIPLCLPNIPNLVSQPFNQVLHRNLSNLNLHAWLLEPQQSRIRASLRQWQHELRLRKEDQPDLSMRQSGPFLQSGASVIRWTSGHHL